MVDEGIVSFSVAAGFLLAVPLCAVQGSLLVEWSLSMFAATWVLALLTAYPFVCALFNACFLAAPPDDVVRAAAGKRMETATIAAGAFGMLCSAFLTAPSRADSASVDAVAIVGIPMYACLVWYGATRLPSKSGDPSASVLSALASLLVSSTAFGLVCTAYSAFVWKVLVLLYPLNIFLILAKRLRGRLGSQPDGRAERVRR